MLLLLAGTTEARQIAGALADRGHPAIATLAGATRAPQTLPLPTQRGGFGGEAGFRAFLQQHAISAILDATHPFATRITERSARIARDLGLPYLQLLRPEWRPGPGDRWTMIAREDQAARHIAPGATVFLATGRQSLPGFANLATDGRRLICRRIDAPRAPFPYPNGEYLLGRGPFTVAQERALFERLGVEALVVKNAGGTGSAPKLEAARALGLPVVMLARPTPLDIARVETVAEALAWVRDLGQTQAGRAAGGTP